MKTRIWMAVLLMIYTGSVMIAPSLAAAEPEKPASEKLLILFTTGEKEVFTKMVFPYASFSKKQNWFSEVRFLIWGPSAKMIAEDTELHEALKQMKETGVELLACKWCAEQYGVDGKLAELGVTVEYMGQPLSDMLKSGWKTLTF